MSDRKLADVRTIHPRTLSIWGEATCLVAIEVARDLRSGVIPPEEYDQGEYGGFSFCGTACCIAGHIARRLEVNVHLFAGTTMHRDPGVAYSPGLFGGGNPSDPILAADAIERYVYDGSNTPWSIPRRLD